MTGPAFVRPNGKAYRPRRTGLWARSWQNDGCQAARGVIIFGTLEPSSAQEFAQQMSFYWHEEPRVTDPAPGWYRDSYAYRNPTWRIDEERGMPGVMFTTDDS